MINFIAIDVETANADLSSICQIGIVRFEDGKAIEAWQSFVNPEDYFSQVNVSIHGITEDSVATAPKYPEIDGLLRRKLAESVVVCHTPFDRAALDNVCSKYGLESLNCVWLDTARVARRTWTQFAYEGYGLSNLTAYLGIQFRHHVAVEDARAAGEILVRAIQDTNIQLQDWLIRVEKPVFYETYKDITRTGNPEGVLFGEEIVFTGALTISRRQAADLASQLGCNVNQAVTKKTTLLVVGNQDLKQLAGYEKSSKHRKAEELIKQGQSLRIIGEKDFLQLVEKNVSF